MNLKTLATREAKKARLRRDCEAKGGHYWKDAGEEVMPDELAYPLEVCKCGARRLLPRETRARHKVNYHHWDIGTVAETFSHDAEFECSLCYRLE